ncbi:hypothetical protein NBRC116592_25440 [Colwellia sp. KU-HH00111]|uniref:hypothetical protein n=1 Tax=Colwellia sp. KU-HH00111 TaxID=3127652 RepID=UPI00310588BC
MAKMKNKKKIKSAAQPCPCTIDKLELTCGHGRKASSTNILQIVASPGKFIKESKTFGTDDVNVQIEQSLDYCGSDNISIKLLSGGGCQEEIKIIGGAFSGEWKAGATRNETLEVESFNAKKKATPRLKLSKAKPETYIVQGQTVAGSKSGKIEQYPSDKYSYTVKVAGLKHISEKFNKSWESFAKKAFAWSPIEVKPTIDAPVGYLKAEQFWAEESGSWLVYHEWLVEAGLDPLFGFKVAIEVSLGTCAYGAVGVPPPVAKMLAKHVADIIFGAEIGVVLKLQGSLSRKVYTTGMTKSSGKLVGTFEGFFAISLTARAGSDYIISIALKGEGKVTIANENEFNINGDELSFQPKLALKPIEVTVSVKTKAFVIFSKSKSKVWKLWKKDKNIWEGKKRVLVDFS